MGYCDFCKWKNNSTICGYCNLGTQYEETPNVYSVLWERYCQKWGFNSGMHGIIGSYMFCRSNGKFRLNIWVSDKRRTTKMRIKEIFSTFNAYEMDKYLEANSPK